MRFAEEFLVRVIVLSSGSHYLSTIIWQVIGWTIADIVIVFGFLKIADIINESKGKRKATIRYFILSLSIVVMFGFIFYHSEVMFTYISLGTAGTHYLIIIYTFFEIRIEMVKLFSRFKEIALPQVGTVGGDGNE